MKKLFNHKITQYILSAALVLLCPVLCIFLSNYILRLGLTQAIAYILPRIKISKIAYLFLIFPCVIITLITRKVSLAYLLVGGISVLGGAAYYYKCFFRGEALFPTDLVFLTKIAGMAREYDIVLTKAIIMSVAAVAVAVVVSRIITLPKISGRYTVNLFLAFLVSLGFFSYYNNYILDEKYFVKNGFSLEDRPVDAYYVNTFHTAFLYYARTRNIEKPKDYTEKAVNEIISENRVETGNNPDIIFIMLETWFDPQQLFGLEFSKTINETYNKMSAEGIYGDFLSMRLGGGTSDLEFNVLNSFNSTLFPETISYMYMFGNSPLPSFVTNLKNEGYRTMALHSHNSELYNRINSYENMGFDSSKFIDEYKNLEQFGFFASDMAHIEEMIYEYERLRSEGDSSIMLYGVSMQNHVSMSVKNIENKRIYLTDTGYSEDFTEGMEIIATYMNQTDMALKRLYDYFKNVDREVVIVLYGDHQSYGVEDLKGFTAESLNEIEAYANLSEKEKYIATLSTPFVMWSNKQDMGGRHWPLVSPHNIWPLACHSFKLTGDTYDKYLFRQMQEVPVINSYAGIYCDRNGNLLDEVPENIINELLILNYDRIFGEKYSLN